MMGSGRTNGEWARSGPPNAHIIYKIGIYGWRKRCLYLFTLLLMIIVIINLALTIWILKVMDFSVHGMGELRVLDDGIRVEGEAEFLKPVYASHIRSWEDKALYIDSRKNITINTRDKNNRITNRIFVGDSKIVSYTNKFEILSHDGSSLFYADSRGVGLGRKKLSLSGGATFKGSVQTPLVRAEAFDHLRLESPTGSLHVSGPQGVHLNAPGGAINLDSVDNIHIRSTNKAIKLDAKNITLKGMRISAPHAGGRTYPEVYQLCICANNGKLFLSPASGNCRATNAVCN